NAATRQILANGVHIGAGLAISQSCQALRDTRDSTRIPQDFQRHFHTLKVIHRQQDSLSFAVAGQGDAFVLLAHSPGQLREAGLGFGQGNGCRGNCHNQKYRLHWSIVEPTTPEIGMKVTASWLTPKPNTKCGMDPGSIRGMKANTSVSIDETVLNRVKTVAKE